MTVCGARHAGAVLTIDLQALRGNYRLLKDRVGPAVRCSAVVKADAYGLGARHVAPALYDEGCRDFFVAHLDEGLSLRPHLPRSARIFILNGLPGGGEADCAAAGLVPVLNSAAQFEAWADHARQLDQRLRAVIQIDSGMSRLGMPEREFAELIDMPARTGAIDIAMIMSHLACADAPAHPANAMQLASFLRLATRLPGVPRSLANSSGIFLHSDFHQDLVRPGAALYGVNPVSPQRNPMRPVVRLTAQVIQTRQIAAGDHVGYGWDFRAERPTRLATLSIGYADGLHRALAKGGVVHFEDCALPIAGRVSMDSICIDVSALPPGRLDAGSVVEVIGDHQHLDDLADAIGTIGYEVLTALGHRYQRNYLGAAELPRAELAGELVQ